MAVLRYAGADRDGTACDVAFQEVAWDAEVLVRGRHRGDQSGAGTPQPPTLQGGAVRAWEPSDKAEDLTDSDGNVRHPSVARRTALRA